MGTHQTEVQCIPEYLITYLRGLSTMRILPQMTLIEFLAGTIAVISAKVILFRMANRPVIH